MKILKHLPFLLLLPTLFGQPIRLLADDIQVAVAANFSAPMELIATEFEKATSHRALLTFGSTGKFYTQIQHGAPFEILLAADARTPEKLVAEGAALADSRFTYAIGRLVLWSLNPDLVDAQGAILAEGGFKHLAIASPRLAPYGAAAIETLTRLGLLEMVRSRFVQGENISQTYQFVASGNAELGFVAKSQVYTAGKLNKGSGWLVPAELHNPIRQDAVLLNRGKDNPAAASLMKYLTSDSARAVIEAYGYALPPVSPR
ncbi:MAG: molybdate ABC transporter substrate-binding protein [Gammaproteobacteria bacterium]|nr:molybdate ABC transporter substrate-binding protein [Gammaproteobacteria bacterium]MBU2478067.1 molybdate ABC transporter substrate-binding protein [Gammaproteobacteria bacterium]